MVLTKTRKVSSSYQDTAVTSWTAVARKKGTGHRRHRETGAILPEIHRLAHTGGGALKMAGMGWE